MRLPLDQVDAFTNRLYLGNPPADLHRPIFKRWLLPLVLILAAGCEPKPMATAFHLAMVDYWPEQQFLFVAARGSGTVDVLRIPLPPRQGAPEYVERLEDPSRKTVVRLTVDRSRGRLWVADFRAVYVYHFKPPGPTTVIPIPVKRHEDRINDFSLDKNGNGYVHTRSGSLIYRVDADKLQLTEWLEPFKPLSNYAYLSPERVLHTKDQRYLLFQSLRDGGLIRIDIASREIRSLRMPRPFDLGCGLLFWADDWRGDQLDSVATDPRMPTAKAIYCLGRWTAEIEFDSDITRATARIVSQ